jgi:extracellular factor (EF) 3-hydroxypalmitic acid methyl ester biosynthesis protein
MHTALELMNTLAPEDAHWLLDIGVEQVTPKGKSVLREGAHPDSLFIMLDGLVAVHYADRPDLPIAKLGPGELIGEVSLVEDIPASATVTALEESRVLRIPRGAVATRLAADRDFEARLYHSFARVLSRRLRERGASAATDKGASPADQARGRVELALERLKQLFFEAERHAVEHKGQLPDGIAEKATGVFDCLVASAQRELGHSSPLPDSTKMELGLWLQREFLPFILLTRNVERWYSKPRGYAGDFLTIDWVYENQGGGSGSLGPLIDRLFLDRLAPQAVRNRRALLCGHIADVVAKASRRPARVLSLACGPAREVFDAMELLPDPTALYVTLVDIDPKALDFVRERRNHLNLEQQMALVRGNLVYLATGRETESIEPQDFVYSIGLIDYFEDRFVVELMNYVCERLRRGGKAILGNFHKRNPDKVLMDYVLNWRLIHRDKDDMNRLFSASRFGKPCSAIHFESGGVNMFAECVKD